MFLQKAFDQPGIRDIPHHHLTPPTFLLFLEIRPVTGIGQFVQYHHLGLGPHTEKMPDIVRPDKPTPPRHQNYFTHQSEV